MAAPDAQSGVGACKGLRPATVNDDDTPTTSYELKMDTIKKTTGCLPEALHKVSLDGVSFSHDQNSNVTMNGPRGLSEPYLASEAPRSF